MLLKFVVENVLSYGDTGEFSLVESRRSPHHNNHVVDLDGARVLRGSVIYGANAAGKSNLLKALSLLITMFRTRNCLCLNGKRFQNGERPKLVSRFEVYFSGIGNSRIFKYCIEADPFRVRSETLESLTDEQVLLHREGLHVDFPKSDDSWFVSQWDRSLRREVLCFPSMIDKGIIDNAGNIQGSSIFVEAINGIGSIHVLPSDAVVRARPFCEMLDMGEFRSFLLDLIRFADVGISDIAWRPIAPSLARHLVDQVPDEGESEPIRDSLYFMSKGGRFYALSVSNGKPSLFELKFKHGRIYTSGANESEGTIRILHMAAFLFDLAKSETVWFVDEIDCHLHPFLAKELLKRFFNEFNSRSQLIVTTHDTNLMNSDLWRPDEIWFAEKRHNGATELYSMFQFAPRFDKNLAKGYLQGLYGAIPFLTRENEEERYGQA